MKDKNESFPAFQEPVVEKKENMQPIYDIQHTSVSEERKGPFFTQHI